MTTYDEWKARDSAWYNFETPYDYDFEDEYEAYLADQENELVWRAVLTGPPGELCKLAEEA